MSCIQGNRFEYTYCTALYIRYNLENLRAVKKYKSVLLFFQDKFVWQYMFTIYYTTDIQLAMHKRLHYSILYSVSFHLFCYHKLKSCYCFHSLNNLSILPLTEVKELNIVLFIP